MKKSNLATDWRKGTSRILQKCMHCRMKKEDSCLWVDFQGNMPQIYCSLRWMGIAFFGLGVDSFLRKSSQESKSWVTVGIKNGGNSGMKKSLEKRYCQHGPPFIDFSFISEPKKVKAFQFLFLLQRKKRLKQL